MEDVFEVGDLEYADTLSAVDIEERDSLSDIRFVLGLEQELGIRFNNSEISVLGNVGRMVDLIVSKLN
ncbi:MAG: acyl carrier protein [Erythrobacter sp.]